MTDEQWWKNFLNQHVEIEQLHSIEELEAMIETMGGPINRFRSFLHKQRGMSPIRGRPGLWVRTKPL
ncbi:MAG: hypothetical protein OXI72_12580 [Gemmatimonadota bacterium]|nr:hypothetical protein [Gemmatimonadota bacterium]